MGRTCSSFRLSRKGRGGTKQPGLARAVWIVRILQRSPIQLRFAQNQVLTVQDLAHYLKVHPSTIYRLLKTGQLPAFKVGSDWRFGVEEIDSPCA